MAKQVKTLALGGYRTIVFGTMDGKPAMRILTDRNLDEALASGPIIQLSTVRDIVTDCTPARWPTPDDERLMALVHMLNIIRVTVPPPRTSDSNPAVKIRKAISVLMAELPPIVARNVADQAAATQERREPFLSLETADIISKLMEAAKNAQALRVFRPRPKGKRSEEWHQVARAISFRAKSIWHPAKVGAGTKAGSPVVKLAASLLPLVGCGDRSPDSIAKAFAKMGKRAKAAEYDD